MGPKNTKIKNLINGGELSDLYEYQLSAPDDDLVLNFFALLGKKILPKFFLHYLERVRIGPNLVASYLNNHLELTRK